MSRMFRTIDSTYNVFVGCKFDCIYCVARSIALGRLKNSPRYRGGFKPHLVESELSRRFKPGEFIFVAYMGDIAFATREEFLRILARIREFPQTDFLIQTKNPMRIYDWGIRLPDNVVLGTTIETNRGTAMISKAPLPHDRFVYLVGYQHPRKFLSIEPIMDFDLDILVSWVRVLKPEIVEVGADNYHNNLVEPPWWKVEELLMRLRAICPRVEEKEGLERLKGG
jgi:hypothetical protein